MQNLPKYAPVILRIGVALLFLWFGVSQLQNSMQWTKLIPDYATSITNLNPIVLVRINGVFEIVFGAALLAGFYTRIVAFILALHVLHIVTIVGYNAIGARDFCIFMATLSTAFYGGDTCTLDRFFLNKKLKEIST